jgi:hypothetical protein
MIQLKATCLRCEGRGYDIKDASSEGYRHYPPTCLDCDGEGTIILDDRKWDISIERVPPFSLEEMEETRGK